MANFPYSEDRPRPCLSPARRAPTAVVDPYSFPPSPRTFARPPVYHSRPLLGHIFHGRGSPDAESEDESGKSARAPSLEAKTARRPSPRGRYDDGGRGGHGLYGRRRRGGTRGASWRGRRRLALVPDRRSLVAPRAPAPARAIDGLATERKGGGGTLRQQKSAHQII